jgi:hypothetical protein
MYLPFYLELVNSRVRTSVKVNNPSLPGPSTSPYKISCVIRSHTTDNCDEDGEGVKRRALLRERHAPMTNAVGKDALNNKRSIDVPHCKPAYTSTSHVTAISASRITTDRFHISGNWNIVAVMNGFIDLPPDFHRAHHTAYC